MHVCSDDLPMRISLSVRQLEAVLRVAELHSFSEAGRVLHVSQPALSRTIQQAEDLLGARLFDRNTRNVKLTAVGDQLLPIARRLEPQAISIVTMARVAWLLRSNSLSRASVSCSDLSLVT